MESLVNIENNSPKPKNGFQVMADLKFIQKEPLVYRKRYIGINDNIIGSKELFIEDILKSFVKRNCEMRLKTNKKQNNYLFVL